MTNISRKPSLKMALNPDDYMPGISIDCVIFGYSNQQLKILLLKWKHQNLWTLPGGFIRKDEDMKDAANRVLEERTGLKSVFLNQFHTFGDIERSLQNGKEQLKRMEFIRQSKLHNDEVIGWLNNRFITTGYFALVDLHKTKPEPDALSDTCEWKSLTDMPDLMMDHKQIVEKALTHLRIQLNYLPIGLSLLPAKFTFLDLQKLYEAILQKPLERSNFQRKVLKLGILRRHEKQMTGAANKAPYLYSFDKKKFKKLIEEGIGFSY
ncbi:NUDIX hydrolase [Muriicola sp. Z0-33]|uniref:NUDIX hydrolase n=1 Tax=Muriicola sp. Z0-33 TaxID=2816957 RepID=UPI002238620A|nr:NUDIX domain-containing protein [Muriicola sp. Z0-33]MCW5514934.1 NUDIX domain-containing protein [Muriicola sp. Z0-33]